MSRYWIALLGLGLLTCSKKESPVPVPAKIAPQPSSVERDATVQTTVSADLLHESNVELRLSEAGLDYFPEYLVDGREETAWHPAMARPSATIDIQLPEGAVAKHLAFRVRAPKSRPKATCEAHWFADEREQGKIAVTFDNDSTNQWSVTVPARNIRLEFRGKTCAHLRLTELELKGELPAAQRLNWAVPEVLLGNSQPDFRFEPKSLGPLWRQGRFESLGKLCEAQTKLTAEAAAKADPNQPAAPSSYCTPEKILSPTKPLAEPFLAVHLVTVGEESGNHPRLLFVNTTRGWYPVNFAYDAGTSDDRAATVYATETSVLETRAGRLWLVFTRRRADFFGSPGVVEAYNAVAEFTYVCTLTERLICHRAVTAFGESNQAWTTAFRLGETPKPSFHPDPWNWRRPFTVGTTGALRFGPCNDAQNKAVPCQTDSMNHLLLE
jgi:hypothetical protein